MRYHVIDNTVALPLSLIQKYCLYECATEYRTKSNPALDINYANKFRLFSNYKTIEFVYQKTTDPNTEKPVVYLDPYTRVYEKLHPLQIRINGDFIDVEVRYNSIELLINEQHCPEYSDRDSVVVNLKPSYMSPVRFSNVTVVKGSVLKEPSLGVSKSFERLLFKELFKDSEIEIY